MNEMTRKRLEMGRRVLAFCRAHPSTDPGYLALVARLETLLARARELERQEKLEAEELQRIQAESASDVTVIPFERPAEN